MSRYIHVIWRMTVFGILTRTTDNLAKCKQIFQWKAAEIQTEEGPGGGHVGVESLEPLFLYHITYQYIYIEVHECMWCSCERASWTVLLLRLNTSVFLFFQFVIIWAALLPSSFSLTCSMNMKRDRDSCTICGHNNTLLPRIVFRLYLTFRRRFWITLWMVNTVLYWIFCYVV